MLNVVDLILIGRLSVLEILKKMQEDGDDLNSIQFDYEINKEIENLPHKQNFQFCLGRLSALQYLKEFIKIGNDLNLLNLENLIQQNLSEIKDEELSREAKNLVIVKTISSKSVEALENSTSFYSDSKIISDLKKCENLLDSLLRRKSTNQEMLSDEFPKEFEEAEKTRINRKLQTIKPDFDDAIEFMKLNTKLFILFQKKEEWNEIPNYVIDAFFQIKNIQNLSTNQKGNESKQEISMDTKILGKIYCKKILDFFEKLNSQ